MSHYVCPKCQHKAYIFGQDGARNVAKEMDMELLGMFIHELRCFIWEHGGLAVNTSNFEPLGPGSSLVND